MRNPSQLLRAHWGKLVALIVLATGSAAFASVPTLHDYGHQGWQHALAWAGFTETATDTSKVFWCPMHPEIKSNKDNAICPICNMALVELEGGIVEAPDNLTLTTRQVQQAGVVAEPALRRNLYREIDTTGRFDYDERRLAKITSWVQGKSRIEQLHVSFMGQQVEKGEPLAELYSPDLITAQREYLVAMESVTRQSRLNLGSSLLESARQKLKDQGLTDGQIDRLHQTRQPLDRITILSPISGTVLARNVQEGQYVNEGDVLFEVADLSQLWLFADVYEDELSLVQVGQSARLTVGSFPGEAFSGEVAFIDPMVMSESRTVRVRINVPNPEARLKPGMFARAQLRQENPNLLAVPENAILWSGQRTVAIVRVAEGMFQPREVQIGRRWLLSHEPVSSSARTLEFGAGQRRYNEVLDGLNPGEQVVTSGAFLLSAESQFQSVLTKMLPPHEHRISLEDAVGASLAGGIRSLMGEYYALSSSLANDRSEEAAAAFASLAGSAASLNRLALQEGTEPMATAAGELAQLSRDAASEPTKDLEKARSHFGRVSRELIQLLAANGGQVLFGKDLFLFECGMSGVGYENWLWWSDDKLNPYMGKKMLTCGSQLDVLEP